MNERLAALRFLVAAKLLLMTAPRAAWAICITEGGEPGARTFDALQAPRDGVIGLLRGYLEGPLCESVGGELARGMIADIEAKSDAVAVLVLPDDGETIELLFAERPDDLQRWSLVQWSAPAERPN